MNTPPTYQELYDACFVPGSWTCPECGFVWNKSTITMEGIGTIENDRQSDMCPNDGEWMVPTTYQHVARSLHERLMIEFKEKEEGTAEQKALRNCIALAGREVLKNPVWEHVIRFCKEGGVTPNILREDF